MSKIRKQNDFYETRAVYFFAVVPFCFILLFHFGSCSINNANIVKKDISAESQSNAQGSTLDQQFDVVSVKNSKRYKFVPPYNEATIAQGLGISPDELKSLTELFYQSVRLGRLSKAYEKLCQTHTESCELLSKYFADGEESQKQQRTRRRERRKSRVRRYYLSPRQVLNAQSQDFWRHFRYLKVRSANEVKSLLEEAIKTEACPRNLSAALALKATSFFPDEALEGLSKQAFEHAYPCINGKDRMQEVMALRFGLIAYQESRWGNAKEYLTKALDIADPRERYRTLFWLGSVERKQGSNSPASWKKLISEFPLSYYSVRAAHEMNMDPLQFFAEEKQRVFLRESEARPEINLAIRWVEALIWYDHGRIATYLLDWMNSEIEELELAVVHYIAAISSQAGLYRPGIAFIRSYYRLYPQKITLNTLKLLYPKPYAEIIKSEADDKIQASLVTALIRQESAFDYRAISPAKAKGLMQILPRTARRLKQRGHRVLFNIDDNVYMGVKYLVRVSKRFGNDVELVLAGYNAGPFRVSQWLKRHPFRDDPLLWNEFIPFMETRDYVTSISRNNYWYIRLYPEFLPFDETLIHSKLVSDVLPARAKRIIEEE